MDARTYGVWSASMWTHHSRSWPRLDICSERLVFKTMVWKCVHGVAPAYLSDLCVPATAISGRQHLRSGSTRPDCNCNWIKKFRSQRTSHWNRLPPALPDLSESAFKRILKTHLFSTARRHWDVFMILAPHIQTYLLTYLHAKKSESCNAQMQYQWVRKIL